MDDAVIWAVAASFAGMGLYALAKPAGVLALFGVKVETPQGRNEARAVYGGFGIAIAAALGIAATETGDLRKGILITVALALVGMAAGRIVGGVIDRPAGLWPVWTFFLIEATAATALLAVA